LRDAADPFASLDPVRIPVATRSLPGDDDPRWHGRVPSAVVRLGILCLFIVLIGMIRPRLTVEAAGWVLLGCGIFTVLAGLAFLGATRRVLNRFQQATGTFAIIDAVRLLVRRTGLPLLALAFFLVWTFVYLGLWWYSPDESFVGLAKEPRFADFFYYAVSTAFISPPGDIIATSRGARSATMIEMLTGFALLTAWLSSLFELRRESRPAAPVERGPEP
jgi:hypothetical protein